jgi:tetratricopeptide (TPR) repeat protein
MNPSLLIRLVFVLVGIFSVYIFFINFIKIAAAYYNNRGIIKKSKNDLDGAITDYDKAIALNPKSAKAHTNRGNAKHLMGNLADAIADHDKAIELNPGFAKSYNNRAQTKQSAADLDGAIADYNAAIELNSNYALAYRNRGVAKEAKSDLAGAIDDYKKAIASSKDDAAYSHFRHILLTRRLYRDYSTPELAQTVANWKDSWLKTVGLHLTGTLAESDFLAQAAQGDAKTVRERQCEAYYYVGMTHLLANETAVAQKFFEKCVGTKMKIFDEFILARAELARLSSKQ